MKEKEKDNKIYPELGLVCSPNMSDKWTVVAVDIKKRIFLETKGGLVYFYTLEEFNRIFSILN